MKMISLRIPDELHASLLKRANNENRSLNQYCMLRLSPIEFTDKVVSDMWPEQKAPTEQKANGPEGYSKTPHVVKLVKAKEPLNSMLEDDTPMQFLRGVNLCKVHDLPLTPKGKCLQKGCKYA